MIKTIDHLTYVDYQGLLSKIVGTSLSKINIWDSLTYLLESPAFMFEYTPSTRNTNIYVDKVYRDSISTEKLITDVVTIYNAYEIAEGHELQNIVFTKDFDILITRKDFNDGWNRFNPKDRWEILNINTLATILTGAAESGKSQIIIWAIGDKILRTSTSWIPELLSAIIFDQYCDKLIPITTKTPVSRKVSRDGFGILFTFFWELLCPGYKHSATAISRLYNDFDEQGFVPFVPTKWNTDDTEFLKMDRLEKFLNKFNDRFNNEEDREEDEEVREDDEEIKELIVNGLDAINRALIADNGKIIIDPNSNTDLERITLSELLDGYFLESPLAQDETTYISTFNVDIDCDLVAGGIVLDKDFIGAAVFNLGVLEVLIPSGILESDEMENLEEHLEIEIGLATIIMDDKAPVGEIYKKFMPLMRNLDKGEKL